MKGKSIVITVAIFLTLGILAFTYNLINKEVENNEEEAPITNEEDANINENQAENSNNNYDINLSQATETREDLELQRKIFFIENPKYQNIDERIINLLSTEVPGQEDDWEKISYIINSYLYGILEKKMNYAWPHFELEDDSKSRKTIKENMRDYKLNLEELELISFSNDEKILFLLFNPYEIESNRLLAFDLHKERITSDQEFLEDEFMHMHFDLPAIEGILKDKRYSKLYEDFLQSDLELGKEVKNILAESLIYYLYGMLSGEDNLVSSFSHLKYSQSDKDRFEELKEEIKLLESFDFYIRDIKQSEAEPETSLVLQFENKDIIEEWMFVIYVDALFINISSMNIS